jgi:hypothetical protein
MCIAPDNGIGGAQNLKSTKMTKRTGLEPSQSTNQAFNGLPQIEWDFRAISTDDLHEAILYEYARSVDWVRQEFENWHKQIIHLPKGSENFCKWNEKTVNEVIHSIWNEAPDLPVDVSEALNASIPNNFSERGIMEEVFIIGGLEFPQPFVNLTYKNPFRSKAKKPKFRELRMNMDIYPRALIKHGSFEEKIANQPRDKPIAKRLVFAEVDLSRGETKVVKDFIKWFNNFPKVRIRKENVLLPAGSYFKFLKNLDEPTYHRPIVAEVDFSAGKTKVANDLMRWIRGLPKLDIKLGKAVSPPWDELRKLAAYRLNKVAGLSFEKALPVIETARQKFVPCDDNVLPDYASSGGFYDAANSAAARIKRLFPKLH